MHHIMKSWIFYNFTRWIYNGRLIAIISSRNDIITVYFDHLKLLPPIMDFSYVVIGLSVFIVFTMLEIFNLFVTSLKKRDASLRSIQKMSRVSGIEYFFYEKVFSLSTEFSQAFEIPGDKLIFYVHAFIDRYVSEQDKYFFSNVVKTVQKGS
jgi:hypothetical protein